MAGDMPFADRRPVEDPLAIELREWMVNDPTEPDVNDLLRRAATRLDEFYAVAGDVLFSVQLNDGESVLASCEPDARRDDEVRYRDPNGHEFVLLPVLDQDLIGRLAALVDAAPSSTSPAGEVPRGDR